MYIQITDHCNMTCAHCCFNCSPKKRNFMAFDTFKHAVQFAGERGETVVLGGGEPTLHPLFWMLFGAAMAEKGVESVWMATNGSQTDIALALAGIASGSERFGVALSQDAYHAEIDTRVVDRFYDLHLEIRNVTYNVVRQGRAKKTQVWQKEACPCSELFVDTKGHIYSCGCRKLEIGDVFDGFNGAGERLEEAVGRGDAYFGMCFFEKTADADVRRMRRWVSGRK